MMRIVILLGSDFKYIYDNLATTGELFDIYNQFYCAVSGSIVSPGNNYDIIKVNDLGGNCVYGNTTDVYSMQL